MGKSKLKLRRRRIRRMLLMILTLPAVGIKKIRFDDKDKDEHKTTSVVNGDEKPRAAKVSSKTTEVNKITDTPTKTKPEAKPTPSKESNAPLVQSSKRKIESNPTTSTDYDPSRSDKKEKSKVPRAARRSDSKTVGKDANLYDEITSSEDEDSAKTSSSKSRRTQKGKDNVTSEPIKSRENVKRPDRVVDIRRAKPEKRNIRIENEDRRASSAETKRNDNSRRNVTAPIRSYDRPAPRDVKESRRRPESPRSREMHAIKSRRGSADHARSGSERSRHYGR